MERYFVLEITTADGATAKAVHEKATMDEARMLFHQILASAYANDKVTYALVQIISDKGFCVVSEVKPSDYGQEEEI